MAVIAMMMMMMTSWSRAPTSANPKSQHGEIMQGSADGTPAELPGEDLPAGSSEDGALAGPAEGTATPAAERGAPVAPRVPTKQGSLRDWVGRRA